MDEALKAGIAEAYAGMTLEQVRAEIEVSMHAPDVRDLESLARYVYGIANGMI